MARSSQTRRASRSDEEGGGRACLAARVARDHDSRGDHPREQPEEREFEARVEGAAVGPKGEPPERGRRREE